MRFISGKACGLLADQLPISDEDKSDFKVGCKAVFSNPISAIFHSAPIGPEPDRSSAKKDEPAKISAENNKGEGSKKSPDKNDSKKSTSSDRNSSSTNDRNNSSSSRSTASSDKGTSSGRVEVTLTKDYEVRITRI